MNKIVDLFCGCGGMSLGFQNAGFNIVGAYELWLYPFTTMIKADYLISSHLDMISFVFIIQTSSGGEAKCDYLCCSAFTKGERDYETNQRTRTILKKERIHTHSNTCTVLLDKLNLS